MTRFLLLLLLVAAPAWAFLPDTATIIGSTQTDQTGTWTNATAGNTALTITTTNYPTVIFNETESDSGSAAINGGVIIFEGDDGTSTFNYALSAQQYIFGGSVLAAGPIDTQFNLTGAVQVVYVIPNPGFKSMRARLSTVITQGAGTGTASALVRLTASTLPINMPYAQHTDLTRIGGSTVVAASAGVQKVGIVGNSGAILDGVIGAATAPARGIPALGVFNSTELSPTTGQSTALQLDSKGRLRTVLMDGGATTTAATVKAASTPSLVTDPALVVTPRPIANPICTTVVPISQTGDATVITGVSAQRIYICSIVIVVSAAETVSVVEGTGTLCATGSKALIGNVDTTFDDTKGLALAANGGWTQTAGTPFMKTRVDADNLCIRANGSSAQISGAITYVIQ